MGRLFEAGYVFEDDDSQPLSGGRIYFYTSGTTTLKATYADSARVMQNANPIRLDIDGRSPVDAWGSGTYTQRVVDANGALIWTDDEISSGDATGIDYSPYSVRTVASKLSDIAHVKDYGAVGDGTTDDTAAIARAAAAISNKGMLLFDTLTYRIFPTGSITGSNVLVDLTDLNGFTIDGRGATLSIGDTFSGTEYVTLFQMTRCKNAAVKNFNFTATKETSPNHTVRGMRAFVLGNACENVEIENMRQTSGLSGIVCYRNPAADSVSAKSRNIDIRNYYLDRVGYPLAFQHSGDRVFARGIYANEPGAPYTVYGSTDHDIQMGIKDAYASCNIACYTLDTASAVTEKIELNLNYESSAAITQPDVVALTCYSENPTTGVPAIIRDIKVWASGTASWSGAPTHRWFTMSKRINGGGVDPTLRNHILEDIEFGGNILCQQTSAGPLALMSNTAGQGTWTAELVKGLKIKDLYTRGSSGHTASLVDVDSLTDKLSLENVNVNSAITFEGAFASGITYRNCSINSAIYEGVYQSIQVLTGAGAVDLIHDITHIVSTGTNALTLADGVEGQLKTLVMKTNAGVATLTPTTTSGFTSVAFSSVGQTAQLKFTNGAWVNLAAAGAIAPTSVTLGVTGTYAVTFPRSVTNVVATATSASTTLGFVCQATGSGTTWTVRVFSASNNVLTSITPMVIGL